MHNDLFFTKTLLAMLSTLTIKSISRSIQLICTIVLFFSCQKDISFESGGGINIPDPSVKVSSSVSGFVTDENDDAIFLATVQLGNVVVRTDKYGYFEIKNAKVTKDAALVSVIKTGFFKSTKTYIAKADKPAFFRIKLIPKQLVGTVNAAAGGIVKLSNGLSISIPANAVVNAASNTVYTGTINIAAYWFDPTSSDLPNTMPGDLRGLNTTGNVQLLTTYGMAAVELTGSGGEKLQIATGTKATLNFPIPASLLTSAPATIPLWYFDETNGLWKEEGFATKNGSSYVGEVTHFSFWNCDEPGSFVRFDCRFVTADNQPLQNVFVKITAINSVSNTRGSYTNADGYIFGMVPANEQLKLEIFNYAGCGLPAFSRIFNTSGATLSMGTIVIPAGQSQAIIKGTVTNCQNEPVSNGAIMFSDGNVFSICQLSSTGTYNHTRLLCSNTTTNLRLIAQDFDNGQENTPVDLQVTAGINNIAPVQACGVFHEQYITYTINSATHSILFPTDTLLHYRSTGSTVITQGVYGYNALKMDYTFIVYPDKDIAVGSKQELITFHSIWGLRGRQIRTLWGTPPAMINITEYGPVGGFIAGNFSDTFTEYGDNPKIYNISCHFKIRREH